MSKRIFILLGHSDPASHSKIFADAYEAAAKAAGHDVQRLNIGEMQFDPVLHHGYRERMELESDLLKVRELMQWCEHFVLFYPNWWGTMPALLKGMWDRMFLPGFAFKMRPDHMGWYRLLTGRTARVFITTGNSALLDYFMFGNFTNVIKSSILEFAGISTRTTIFSKAEHASDAQMNKWITKTQALAKRAR
jgi:putative NADPH-quinone reductase